MIRILVQAVALFIFGYQMVVALGKYRATTVVGTHETKNIEEFRLPDLYFCIEDEISLARHLAKHGYEDSRAFATGHVGKLGKHVVTWEGSENMTYENITGNTEY